MTSWKLAKGLYIIPLLFAYTPILFEGPVHEVIWVAFTATIGLFGFVVTWEGYYQDWIGPLKRVLVGIASLFLLFPRLATDAYNWLTGGGGERELSEAELLAKAAAEAARLAKAGASGTAEVVQSAASQVPFWPNLVLVSLLSLALLLALLLPDRLAASRRAETG